MMAFNRSRLLDRIVQYGKWDDFLSFASFMWWEKRYSIFNSALIYLQRPGALYVDTESGWASNCGRAVKPEAPPIVVIHPFGPVNFLYELSDTYGDELPDVLRDRFEPPSERSLINADYLPSARNLCRELGIYYGEAHFGTRLHGTAQYLDKAISYDLVHRNQQTVIRTRYAVTVNQSIPDGEKVLAIFHEIGHVLCGHLPYDEGNAVLKPPKRRESLPKASKECEAEKVCELFSAILGYSYDPSDYLQDYQNDDEDVEYSLRYVTEAVDRILNRWNVM